MTGKPISPDDVVGLKTTVIPPEVFDAFNECIAQHWNGRESVVPQDEVVRVIVRKGIERHVAFARGYLDVEESYRAKGWHVEYDKPAYCESYPARFIFRKAASK